MIVKKYVYNIETVMENLEKISQWVEAGKQIGKVFSYTKEDNVYWSSVAVQKWGEKYKLYIDEILESNMDSEIYSREEIISTNSFMEVIHIIKSTTSLQIGELSPCKGQRIFNPSFD